MWDLSSPTRNGTCASCVGSAESESLGLLGKACYSHFKDKETETQRG